MGRRRRDTPWLSWEANGFAYANWYDAEASRTKRVSLKTRDPDEARKAFAYILLGGPPADTGRPSVLTVSEALDFYLKVHVDAEDDRGRPRVADRARQHTIAGHLKEYFGGDPITSIGPLESRAYTDARRKGLVGGGKRRKDKTGSDATIRRELNCLIAAFNLAVKWEKVSGVCRVELPREDSRGKVKWLTKDDLRRLLAASSGDLRDFIMLAYYTAARRRSIENLRTSQVNLRESVIDLMPDGVVATKKRKPIVPIYSEIRPIIEARMMLAVDDRLFNASLDFYRPFRELAAGLGIEAHPHMLRHSRASHMLMDGDDLFKVAKLLGDTVATTERTYGHFSPTYLETRSSI